MIRGTLGVVLGCLVGSGAWCEGREGGAADAGRLLSHIEVLASDEYEGRGPATVGEELTVGYLVEQFQKLGLAPGNPDGTFVQEVPLVGFRTAASGVLKAGASTISLDSPEVWVGVSRRLVPEVRVADSEVVFVGYGVVAPEYGWDDYKGLDVRGKTLLMLVNDPPVRDGTNPDELDAGVFGGRAMTYYGRWTYKYEIAAEKGAAAVLLVHETGPAGYPYEVVKGSWGRENFEALAADQNMGRAGVEAWVTLATAQELCRAAGQEFEALKAQAASKDFQPVALPATASFEVKNALREVKSKNVVARLPGSDPAVADELVVYTAHWDHLGRDEALLPGDAIYNGAADNASGVAGVLEISRMFVEGEVKPKRSVLFLAVTAEEKGLLGSRHYATNPLYPLVKTLAVINMDVINLWGRTADITAVGLGQSTLDDLLAGVAKGQGRVVKGDPEPEKGMYYRSDHFEFARVGVPALNAKGGMDYRDKPAGYGQQKRDEYTANDYHKVTDEVKPGWDLAGAVEDLELLQQVGHDVANGESYPEWKPASEFRLIREKMLKSISADRK